MIARCRGWTADYRTYTRGYNDPRFILRTGKCRDMDPTLLDVVALVVESRETIAHPLCQTASYLARPEGEPSFVTGPKLWQRTNVCRRPA